MPRHYAYPVVPVLLSAGLFVAPVFVVRPLTSAQGHAVAALFHIQQDAQMRELWWPPGQPPPTLAAGAYLVPVQRRTEIAGYPPGQWQE